MCLGKIIYDPCDHNDFCVCVSPINFSVAEPVFMKHGMYIMALEPISTAYFISPYHHSVYPINVTRQRLGRNVTTIMNTHIKIEELLDVYSLCGPHRIKGTQDISFSHNFLLRCGKMLIQDVHFAGLLDVLNILSADNGISRKTEGHSFGENLISGSVSVKLLLCSVLCLCDSCESMFNQPALWTPDRRVRDHGRN
jgi:hypothetical protein